MSGDQLLAALRGAGLIDETTAIRLARSAAESGLPLEEVIMKEGKVDDGAIADAKSAALRVPRFAIPDQLDTKAFQYVPEETARTYQVVPLSSTESNLVVGMVNPDDQRAQEALKFLARQHRLNLGVFLVSSGDWQRAMRAYSPFQDDIQEAVHAYRTKTGGTGQQARRVTDLEEEGKSGDDAPIIRVVARTLKEAIQGGASDVHLEPEEKGLRIRFRVDGELRQAALLPKEISEQMIAQVKVRSELKIDEHRVPQDGRFRAFLMGKEIDFRVATFPTPLGEKMAIRILDPETGLRSFEELGLSGRNLEAVEEALAEPYGMVLVTGPTGSGKTTTLYAALQRINTEKVNIVSLEDPVEYFVEGVNQSQVRPEIGYDFAAGLRQILRQDPDVIMVGEIRDRETADLAVNAALTGHIVLSTLHTNDAAGVIPRLIDMGVEPFLLPAALNLMVAQRLVGRLCQTCKQQEDPSPAAAEEIAREVARMPANVEKPQPPYKLWRSPGCDACHGRGTLGRVALYEVIKMTREIEKIVTTGASASAIRDQSAAQGALTMRQDGLLKALAGQVLFEEVLKETNEE